MKDFLRLTGLAMTAAILVSCTTASADPPDEAAKPWDLLSGHDWRHFAGASVTEDGVRITPLDRRIVDQEGTGGQPNPPVNLRGPRLVAGGDFRITATLEGVGGKGAFLRLYSTAPIVYDEWRREPASMRVGVEDGRLRVSVWDGTADQARTVKAFGGGLSGRVTIEVRSLGGDIHLYADGDRLGTVADPGVFSGTVWFGADAEVGGGWTLTSLTARAEGGDHLTVEDAPSLKQPALKDSLRSRAGRLDRPIGIGTAVAAQQLMADGGYRRLAAGQFSMLTPENDFKHQFTQPRQGVFSFEDGDTLVDFTRANGMAVHAHTLVWHEALPAWMRKVTDPAEVKQMMLDHIDGVAGHFKGKVAEWDVVNEPMSDDDADYTNGNKGLRAERNPWFQAMGERYVDLAFRRAHEVDPDARLFLNEYGAEQDGQRWDALLALVKRLKQRGVPIDGIGFQNHEYEEADRTPPETFRRHLRQLAAIGVQARVSEMDVLVNEDEHGIQAEEFAGKLKVCREEPNCTSFSSWGFTDRYGSNAEFHKYPPPPGDALPWDAELKPKPAYTRMLEQLPR